MTNLSLSADMSLLDFGLSKIVRNDEKYTEPYATLSFIAPKALKKNPYIKTSYIVSRSID